MRPASPLEVIREAIKVVPAVKYALGVAGIASAVAIVAAFVKDPRIAVFGTIIMLVLMVVLVIFAKLASSKAAALAVPAIVLTWFSLVLLMVTSIFLVSSVFFRWPVNLESWLRGKDAAATVEGLIITGRTVDAEGKPIPNILVSLTESQGLLRQQLSNADGVFKFDLGIAPTLPLQLKATFAEYEASAEVTVPGRSQPVTLTIPMVTRTPRGFVLDAVMKTRLPGALVAAMGPDSRESMVTTGADGKFQFDAMHFEKTSEKATVEFTATKDGITHSIEITLEGLRNDIRIELPVSQPPFTQKYVILGGVAMEVLAQEKRFTALLEKELGGPNYIVANTVLERLTYLISRFGIERPNYSLGEGFNVKVFKSEQAEKQLSGIDEKQDRMDALTDARRSKQFINEFLWVSLTPQLARKLFAATFSREDAWQIWFLGLDRRADEILAQFRKRNGRERQADVAYWSFEKRLSKKDLDVIIEHVKPERRWEIAKVELLKYLTRDGMPTGFASAIIATPACGGDDGGLEMKLKWPDLKVKLLLIENSSGDAIRVGEVAMMKLGHERALRARAQDGESTSLASEKREKVYAPERLEPGAQVVIPVEIIFSPGEDEESERQWTAERLERLKPLTTWARTANDSLAFESVNFVLKTRFRNPELIFQLSSREFLAGLAAVADARKPLATEFLFGPSLEVKTIKINGVQHPVRSFDPLTLVYRFGLGVGCCPFIYAFDVASNQWKKEGAILVGNRGKEKEGSQALRLRRSTNKIRIVEEEAEISYIDELKIEVNEIVGETRIAWPLDSRLRNADGNYVILRPGEYLDLEFDEGLQEAAGKVTVWATGYYELLDKEGPRRLKSARGLSLRN